MIIAIATAFVGALIFGWMSRMCGGGKPQLPWGLDQWIYAIPHGVLGFVASYASYKGITVSWDIFPVKLSWLAFYFIVVPATVLSYAFAFAGKRLGHGQWFDLATTKKLLVGKDGKPRVEFLDFIVRLLFGPDPNTIREGPGSYRRDYAGLAISGIFIALGSVLILLGTGHPLYALAVLIAGGSKPLAYAAGLWLAPRLGGEHNEYGEYIAGFIDSFVVFLVILFLLNMGV